jgi:hypothetical protein
MTEAEWNRTGWLDLKLDVLGSQVSERKLRLVACAVASLSWNLLQLQSSRTAIRVAEDYADGVATDAQRETARQDAIVAHEQMKSRGYTKERRYTATAAAAYLPILALWPGFGDSSSPDFIYPFDVCGDGEDGTADMPAKNAIFHDIFGNPFRPVASNPSWRTTDSLGVARAMYDSRDFAAMPILADALEDAGCDSAEVLAHCRGDGPHVRGCWVVDLVLGKA